MTFNVIDVILSVERDWIIWKILKENIKVWMRIKKNKKDSGVQFQIKKWSKMRGTTKNWN